MKKRRQQYARPMTCANFYDIILKNDLERGTDKKIIFNATPTI